MICLCTALKRRWQQKLAPDIEAIVNRIGQNAFADLLRQGFEQKKPQTKPRGNREGRQLK